MLPVRSRLRSRRKTVSGDHNMFQKPKSYLDDDTQYDAVSVKQIVDQAIRIERLELLDFIDEFRGSEVNRNDMFSEGYDYALYHLKQLIVGKSDRDGIRLNIRREIE